MWKLIQENTGREGKMGQRRENANKSYAMKPVLPRELSSGEESLETL